MKRFIALFLIFVMTACLFSACNTEKEPEPPKDPEEQQEVKDFGKIFYVAVDGSDENEGTKESPLATLGGAVAKVREYKTANGLPEGGIKVEFAAGTYKVTTQTDLTAEDSGEEGKEIVYAAADGAEVIFDGGVSLNPADFKPANDDFKAKLVSDEAKQSVLEIDLAIAGIWDADDSTAYGASWEAGRYRQSLYVNNETQTPARWPDEGYYDPETATPDVYTGEDGISYGYISIPQEKALLWRNGEHIRFYGYPYYDWSATFVWDIGVDPEQPMLCYPMNHDYGQLGAECHFYVFNIPSELDTPGEYYWDVAANKLYYWPKENFETAKISFSQFNDSVINIADTDYVTFDGLTFENLRYNALKASGSDNITVSNCVFRCISSATVSMTGTDILIKDNEFYSLGGGGISISGGDIPKQIPAKNIITNNVFHDWSQVYTINNPGIKISGMSMVISHNDFYDSPHEAIMFDSGNTVIEYNNICNMCGGAKDAGAIYAGRRWDWGNTVIRYNYIHDQIYANAIYLDDTIAKITCYGNIITNIDGNAFALGGGRNLTIYNNILVNTSGMGVDGRGYGWYPTVTSYPDGYLWTQNMGANYLTDLWKYMHPEYLSILEMRTTTELDALKGITADMLDSPAPPAYANFYGNIGYNNGKTALSERKMYIFNRNKYLDLNNNEDDSDPASPGMVYSAYLFGKSADNIEYTVGIEDVFVDPANGNFFLKEDSRVYRDIIGFEKWDYSLIGVQK